MIYRGSGSVSDSDFGKVSFPVPVIQTILYLAQFLNNKICEKKTCLFIVRSSIVSKKADLSFLILLLFYIIFMLDPDSNRVPEPECTPVPASIRQKVAVPVPQHWWDVPVVDGGRDDVPAAVRVYQVAALGGTGRRQGQHDRAQWRQLVVQLTRLAAVEKNIRGGHRIP
jgi:hypothetical protein